MRKKAERQFSLKQNNLSRVFHYNWLSNNHSQMFYAPIT